MPATALVTSEQYLALPDQFDQHGDRIKDELIGGEIVGMPTPSQLHDLVKNHIGALLLRFLFARPDLDLKVFIELALKVDEINVLVPDVCVVRAGRIDLASKIFRGAPDLAVEIVSPADTASRLKAKVDAYLANGSQSVWVVFPDAESVMVYGQGSVRELKREQVLEDSLLPGFSFSVSAFFKLA